MEWWLLFVGMLIGGALGISIASIVFVMREDQ